MAIFTSVHAYALQGRESQQTRRITSLGAAARCGEGRTFQRAVGRDTEY
jgi:hypothetical protein